MNAQEGSEQVNAPAQEEPPPSYAPPDAPRTFPRLVPGSKEGR